MKKVLVKKTAVKKLVRLYETKEGGSNTNCFGCTGKAKCCR